jgi:hypothetical protein
MTGCIVPENPDPTPENPDAVKGRLNHLIRLLITYHYEFLFYSTMSVSQLKGPLKIAGFLYPSSCMVPPT